MEEVVKSDILQVVDTGRELFYVTVDYEEGDIGNGSGSVFRASRLRDANDVPERVLASGDMFTRIWMSPIGTIWVASANGTVATTAKVPGRPIGADPASSYVAGPGRSAWVLTALPPVRKTRLPANITSLWGLDDSHVFAGTYGGHVYQWDGASWTQTHEGDGGMGSLTTLAGNAADNVFAAGEGVLLHFDGHGWHPVAVPGDANGHETFTGVVVMPSGEVVVSADGDQSRLLQGSAQGLTELGRYDIPLIGMTRLDERLLFATGDGTAELIGRDVEIVKDNFDTVSVFPGANRVYFIEAEQKKPSFVVYDPAEAKPWWRVKY